MARIGMSDASRGRPSRPNRHLLHWFLAYGLFGVPQAAAPIAFALIALPLTGDAKSGAAIVVAMTIAQVLAAVPVTRLGRRYSAAMYLRSLIAVRAIALLGMSGLAATHSRFELLLIAGAVAGAVNGAAYGYIRAMLNHIVPPNGLPRALGIGATINETTFVAAPVLAAVLGGVSPALSMVIIAALGMCPFFLVHAGPEQEPEAVKVAEGSVFNGPICGWMLCSAAGGAIVATIEVGAVSLALDFGYGAGMGVIFTVALCLASISGGIWVTLRNRMAQRYLVMRLTALMMVGATLVALEHSLAVTVLGCVAVGLTMAPLSTHYSLALDALAPPSRRAEVFALLRTSNSLGVIFAGAMLTVGLLSISLVVAGLVLLFAAWTTSRLGPAFNDGEDRL